jgi:hypothetical protein
MKVMIERKEQKEKKGKVWGGKVLHKEDRKRKFQKKNYRIPHLHVLVWLAVSAHSAHIY